MFDFFQQKKIITPSADRQQEKRKDQTSAGGPRSGNSPMNWLIQPGGKKRE